MDRRTFIRGLGTAGVGLLGLTACRNGGAAARAASPSAPVSGQALVSPPAVTVKRTGNLAQARLIASPTPAVIAGQRVQTLGYNGSVPGPTLRVKVGETLRLTFTNRLAEAGPSAGHHAAGPQMTNLHLHGPRIAPATDGPFLLLEPGASRTIDVELPAASAGTHWYHPHPHGQVAFQQVRGLAGTLLVEGDLDQELRDWEEHLLVIKDFTLKGGAVDGHHGTQRQIGKGGEWFTVNGQYQPVLTASRPGLRLRLVNASTARPYRLALPDQPLHLIATDGHTLEQPVPLTELVLGPGQRADVLVALNRAGTYALTALPYKAVSVSTKTPTPLLTIRTPGGKAPRLPTQLATLERLDPSRSVAVRKLDFTFKSGVMGRNYRFMINGQMFDHDRTDLSARLGTQETWQVENHHSWDLPFHLHSYPFKVSERRMDEVWRPEPHLAWRDTVNIDNGDAVRLLIPFRHYAGKTVYHCHIAEHEDTGMMGVLEVRA